MKYSALIILLVTTLFSACSLFQGDSFSGTWKMTWKTEGVQEEWEFDVKDDNSFETEYSFIIRGEPLPVDFEGRVSEDGSVDGKIFVEGRPVGAFSGTCDYEKGEGTWYGGNFKGTWNIVKQ